MDGCKCNNTDLIVINQEVNGVHISEILNREFMCKYTNFYNFKELTFSSIVWIDWNQPIVYTRESLLNRFIAGSTQFDTWNEMFGKALEEYNAGK